MRIFKLIICMLSAIATGAMAQTYQQKGVVRMITTSASSPIIPVAGVKVAVGNSVSKPTNGNGTFTMQVTKQFQVNGVTPNDEYVLALPTKGKTYYQSQNELVVVVTTKAQRDAESRRMYNRLKAKYEEQTDKLLALKRQYRRQLEEMSANDTRRSAMAASLDSIQALYLDHLNNEEKMESQMRQIADELSITDYQTLDSLNRRLYELKCAGEWKAISDLMHSVMNGDAATYLQQATGNRDKVQKKRMSAEEAQEAAARDMDQRVGLMMEAIGAFMMQHMNDSVSRYFNVLIDAVPDNWELFKQAGIFELKVMANHDRALDYFTKASKLQLNDTLQSEAYANIGNAYRSKGKYDKALEYFKKALDTNVRIYGEEDSVLTGNYNLMGLIYYETYDYTKAKEFFKKAIDIGEANNCEDNVMAAFYSNIGSLYFSLEQADSAVYYGQKALDLHLESLGEEHLSTANDLNNLGTAYSKQGEYDKGLDCLKRALAIRQKILAGTHPDIAICYHNIGYIYYYKNDVVKAVENFIIALQMMAAALGPNHPNLIPMYDIFGAIAFKIGRYDAALACFEAINKIQATFLPADHPDVVRYREAIETVKKKTNENAKQ